MLHAEYPTRAEDALPLWEPEAFVRAALSYLLLDTTAAARLEARPMEQREAIVAALVAARDPQWSEFVARYAEACAKVREFGERMRAGSRLASFPICCCGFTVGRRSKNCTHSTAASSG